MNIINMISTYFLAFFAVVCVIVVCLMIVEIRKNYYERQKYKGLLKLTFKEYKDIIREPELYIFYVPYGISQSLSKFISDIPYFIDALDQTSKKCNYEDCHLNQDFYDAIGKQLATITSNTAKILISRCKFYCDNSSDSFKLECDPYLVQKYCIYANKIHSLYEDYIERNLVNAEINAITYQMYQEFFKFFEEVNSHIKILPNPDNLPPVKDIYIQKGADHK